MTVINFRLSESSDANNSNKNNI